MNDDFVPFSARYFFRVCNLDVTPPRSTQDGNQPWQGLNMFKSANLPSLKLTFSHLKMDGWNTFSFPFGFRPIFRGKLAGIVSGRVVVNVIGRVAESKNE